MKKNKYHLNKFHRRPQKRYYKRQHSTYRKITIYLAIALLGICVASYILFWSDYFKVKNIQIKNTENIDIDTLTNFIQEQVNQQQHPLQIKNNLFLTNTTTIQQNIQQNFPYIETVKITKKTPQTLVVSATKKQSILIWCRDKCFLVNPQGIAFMTASEEELNKQGQPFMKIIEEAVIKEEVQEKSIKNEEPKNTETPQQTTAVVATTDNDTTEKTLLPFLQINDKVADNNFIQLAIDINKKISYNSKLKVVYYKTKGTHTKELIAFTDKNTRIYFDMNKNLDTQIHNLERLTSDPKHGLQQTQIDALQYIYLKNEDRIYYK